MTGVTPAPIKFMNLFPNYRWQRAVDSLCLWASVAGLLALCALGLLAALCHFTALDRWCARQLTDDRDET